MQKHKEHSHTLAQSKPPVPAQATPGLGSVKQVKSKHTLVHTQASAYPPSQDLATGQEELHTGSTGQDFSKPQPSTSGFSDVAVTGEYRCPPEPDSADFDFPQSDMELSDDQPESDQITLRNRS